MVQFKWLASVENMKTWNETTFWLVNHWKSDICDQCPIVVDLTLIKWCSLVSFKLK